MSLKADLREAGSPVGAWAREQFPRCRNLYDQMRDAATPVRVEPVGWKGPKDQRRSWAGTACDTMLRWLLGDSGWDAPTVVGAVQVMTNTRMLPATDAFAELDDLDGRALAALVAESPVLEDLQHAARVAVLWALAEQHFRWMPTVNPLTDSGDKDAETLLGEVVPDDVAEDVHALAAGPGGELAAEISELGDLTFGPEFRRYPGGADADLLAGTTIVELKTTARRRMDLVEVLQPVCYALLSDDGVDHVAWGYPRSGRMLRLELQEIMDTAAGEPVDLEEIHDGFAAAMEET